jgi:hypothetical protein
LTSPSFAASPIVGRLFTEDGIDALSECIRTAHVVADRLGLPAPYYWTYLPAGGDLAEIRTTIQDDDRSVLEIPLPLRFVCIAKDGPDTNTPATLCRLFVHEGTIWTAQELLDRDVNGVPGLVATRRWARRLANHQEDSE